MKALLFAGAALGGLLLLTNKSNAAPAPSAPGLMPLPGTAPVAPSPSPQPAPVLVPPTSGGIVPTNVPPAVLASINAALDTLDPDAINKVADQIAAQGFTAQAADLRAVALGMRNAMQNAVT